MDEQDYRDLSAALTRIGADLVVQRYLLERGDTDRAAYVEQATQRQDEFVAALAVRYADDTDARESVWNDAVPGIMNELARRIDDGDRASAERWRELSTRMGDAVDQAENAYQLLATIIQDTRRDSDNELRRRVDRIGQTIQEARWRQRDMVDRSFRMNRPVRDMVSIPEMAKVELRVDQELMCRARSVLSDAGVVPALSDSNVVEVALRALLSGDRDAEMEKIRADGFSAFTDGAWSEPAMTSLDDSLRCAGASCCGGHDDL